MKTFSSVILSFFLFSMYTPNTEASKRGVRVFCNKFIFTKIQLYKESISTVWHRDFDDRKTNKRIYLRKSGIHKEKNKVYIRCDFSISKTHYKYLKSKLYSKCKPDLRKKHRYYCKD